ncbi:VOC family protein [Rathayibacter sp. Leaf296]|uniref:VOC family protein n=1 Tax=Rathayibacter sp. Leaf296 TaxID=1736327 RepID=UPI000702754B|nr:VOC family protein [Rathayibacter sp. Leaf296]KQQ07606.1 glyoxalase [Rathayibacter sp. Leaf296]
MALRLRQIVLDTEDARGLASFYAALLGGCYRPDDEPPADGSDDRAEWVALRTPEGVRLAFQRVDRLQRATWPEGEHPQQLHLDLMVADAAELEEQRERAVELGAEVIDDQSDDAEGPLYVFADPSGHPFCIFVAEDLDALVDW